MTYVTTDYVPKPCLKYLTPGRRYEVLEYDGSAFYILDNDGDEIYCLWKDCAHIEGDWERAE